MNAMTIFMLFVTAIAILFLFLNVGFAPHLPYFEKISSFECGFHSFLGQNRAEFDISFYIFGLAFLLFDLEITLLYPFFNSQYRNSLLGLIFEMLFGYVITFGFVFEIGKGGLKIASKQDTTKTRPTKSFVNNSTKSFVNNSTHKSVILRGNSLLLIGGTRKINIGKNLMFTRGSSTLVMVQKRVEVQRRVEEHPFTRVRFRVSSPKNFSTKGSPKRYISKFSLGIKMLKSYFIKLIHIFSKRFIKFFCFMPFACLFKSLYSCYHYNNWTFSYFIKEFITHIPFIGSYLFKNYNALLAALSQDHLSLQCSIESINFNQFTGNLMFIGSLGVIFVKSLLEVFQDKDRLLMGEVLNETPKLRIDKNIASSMQADNTQTGKKEGSRQEPSSSSGVSGTSFEGPSRATGVPSVSSTSGISFENVDKLIQQSSQLVNDTKKLIANMAAESSTLSNKDKQSHVDSLKLLREKSRRTLQDFLSVHFRLIKNESFFPQHIKPVTDVMSKDWEEYLSQITQIPSNDPHFLKKENDVQNTLFKKNAVNILELQKRVFEQMKNEAKLAESPEEKEFYEKYKVSVQKAWIREQEAYMAQQKKLRKEVAEMLNKK